MQGCRKKRRQSENGIVRSRNSRYAVCQTLVLSEIPAKGRRRVRDLLGRRGCVGGSERMSENRTKEDLRELQALPLDLKILKTKNRIKEFVDYYGGRAVSYA